MDKEKTFSFGTDFHGNLQNIDQFLRVSKERNVDHVIFGGDITPKKMAVKLADGKGIILQSGDASSDIPAFDIKDAQMLSDSGYMLFNSELTNDKLDKIKSIFEKFEILAHFSASDKDTQVAFTADEIQLIESYILPRLSEALKNDPLGKKIFETLAQKMEKEDATSSVDEFLNRLVLNFKIGFLLKNSLFNNKRMRNSYLCGKQDATDQEFFNRFNYGFGLGKFSLTTLYRYASKQIPPWAQWNDINQNLEKHSLDKQRQFLQELFKRIQDFRQQFRGSVSMIMGNDDHFELSEDFDKADNSGLLIHATNRVVQLADDIQLAGYSFVPPSSANYKEWYKEEAELQNDLRELSMQIRSGVQYLITNTHCPPNQTRLSQGRDPQSAKTDFGSQAIRDFISQTQPVVALTGHIHESWQITGKVADNIGNSVVFNPGASEFKPRILLGNLKNPDEFEIVE